MTDEYVSHGLEGSIKLGHWVEGYHGTKLKSPAIDFRLRSGIWPDFGPSPHDLAGLTRYDRFPEAIGFTVFWIGIVWVVLPLKRYLAGR